MYVINCASEKLWREQARLFTIAVTFLLLAYSLSLREDIPISFSPSLHHHHHHHHLVVAMFQSSERQAQGEIVDL